MLRAMPRLHRADAGLGTGQSKGRAAESQPSHSRVLDLREGGPVAAAAAAAAENPGP